ncbi:hypothetical protein [Edaphobacter modestus]|uniref:Outer membrane beta-barrel porin/alpha-amylase n=1 Tax=Edaphobacter modestus TaxID=388466 RepID=A0A4Q7YWW0_9BACT|nr:hypothetical protein [Edaphobacter modestus]RZU41575.1 hypothetical protein BDD14_3100 [Edaphobacter modestus]
MTRTALAFACWILLGGAACAQTMQDGIMLARGVLCAGSLYTHDQWSSYWEGSRQRVNGNIGTITTQSVSAMANYGITDRINVLANVPYVWTNASQGVLHGQSGFQDFSFAVKGDPLRLRLKQVGTLRAIVLVSTSLPMTNYTPDLQPLSLGLNSKTLTGRGTLNFLGRRGLYLNAGAAYTFRANVTLDRPYYYTNDQMYLSNEVAMPNVFDYSTSVGYYRHDMKIVGNFAQQQTRGGGDIRRQDMPFVSNRMNYSAAGFEIQYPIPHLRRLQYWVAYRNVFDGRNVGQANTITTGLMYTFHREGRTTAP